MQQKYVLFGKKPLFYMKSEFFILKVAEVGTGKNNEMSNYLKAMKKNETLQPGSLVCYKSYPGDDYSFIPHSGILLSSKRGSLFLLHKGGYNDPIKVEPVEEVFKDIKNIRGSQELESYSLK